MFVNSWSWQVNKIVPVNSIIPLLSAVIDSKSKWFVGSSKINTLAPDNIMRENIQRCFSPPEIIFDFFKASSPEKSIRPKNPRIKLSSFSTEYCRSQSTKFIEASSKKEALSFGK